MKFTPKIKHFFTFFSRHPQPDTSVNMDTSLISSTRKWLLRKMRYKVVGRLNKLPNSRSNQNKNQIKPKIWRGSIIG
jgi:hypothetical protein